MHVLSQFWIYNKSVQLPLSYSIILKFFVFFIFRIYGFLHFNFPPRHTIYCLRGTAVWFFTFFFSFTYTLLWKKKAFNKSQGNGHQVSCSLVIQAMSATVILLFLGLAFTGLMFLFNNFFCVYFKTLLSIRILIYIKVPTKWYITWPYLRNKFFH